MKNTKIAVGAGTDTRVVILDSGEEAFAALTKFANDTGITAASLTAIGAFEHATIGWFDFDKNVSMSGDIKLWTIYVSVVLVGAKIAAFAIQYVAFRVLVTSRIRAARATAAT